MKTSESLLSIGKFIAEYSAHLMGAGVHTSRVVRNSKRIGEAFGLDVKLEFTRPLWVIYRQRQPLQSTLQA